MDKSAKSQPIDPILNLPVQSPATSVCFISPKHPSNSSVLHYLPEKLQSEALSHETGSIEDDPHNRNQKDCSEGFSDSDDDDDDEDDYEIEFRSSTIRVGVPEPGSVQKHSNRWLSDRFLASCHSNGDALIWDLKNQKQVATISSPRGGSGICVRRTDDPSQVMFQTRDPKGIVSLHSIERCDTRGKYNSEPPKSAITNRYETFSKTFCRAAPCHGNKYLLALPNIDHSTVTVVDGRTDATVATYKINNHGMVTSLAFSITGNYIEHGNGSPILACGMESGTTVFFDIAGGSKESFQESSFSIGKEPILALDILPSSAPKYLDSSSPVERYTDALLVGAGMAGDTEDVADMSKDEAGRAVIFKTLYCRDNNNNRAWNFKQRARLSTCRVDRETYGGKPGISVCRYRPEDGRLLGKYARPAACRAALIEYWTLFFPSVPNFHFSLLDFLCTCSYRRLG